MTVPLPVPITSDDAPSWTDVLEAIATSVAAVATAATLLFLLLQLRDQQRATRLEVGQARRRQSEQVTISMARDTETLAGVKFNYLLENRSGRPCYFVYFEVFDDNEVVYVRYGTLDTTPATGSVELSARYRSPTKGSGLPGYHSWPYFRVTFMDASNVFWVRDSLGLLEETSAQIARSWPVHGTFAEKRAYQVREATGEYKFDAPRSVTPTDMYLKGGRTKRD